MFIHMHNQSCSLFIRSFMSRTMQPLTGLLRGTMWQHVTCTHLTAHCSPSPTVSMHSTLGTMITNHLQKHVAAKQAARNDRSHEIDEDVVNTVCDCDFHTFKDKGDDTQMGCTLQISNALNCDKHIRRIPGNRMILSMIKKSCFA